MSCHCAASFILGPILRRFHLKTSSVLSAAFLSLVFLWEGEALFAAISSSEGRRAIIERTQCTKEEEPSPLLGRMEGWSSSLSSLSFCGDEDYCSRSLCRSLFSSFFITHPLIFGWLSLCLSVGCRSQEGERVRAWLTDGYSQIFIL